MKREGWKMIGERRGDEEEGIEVADQEDERHGDEGGMTDESDAEQSDTDSNTSESSYESMDSSNDFPFHPDHPSYYRHKFLKNRQLYKESPLIPPLELLYSDE